MDTITRKKRPQETPEHPLISFGKGMSYVAGAVSNLFNSSPPSGSWGGNAYQSQTPPSLNEQLQRCREQQQQEHARQQRALEHKASSSASMVQQNLAEVTQQQQAFTTPKRKAKGKQQTPESQ